MRVIIYLLILLIFFGGGLLGGLMYDTKEERDDIEEEITAELVELNEQPPLDELVLLQLEDKETPPIEIVAAIFEKVTLFIFEKIVSLLYGIAQLLF